MPVLSISLLGGLEARLEPGGPLAFPTKKCGLLLAYLALAPEQPQPRERLVGVLWSDRPEEQARGSLRNVLYALRKQLGDLRPPPLAVDARTVALDPRGATVDVATFERCAASADPDDLEQACALYRGDLLQGVLAPDEAFEAWLRGERSRLRDLAIAAHTRMLDHRLATGALSLAERTARRLLELDPLREETHRHLMVLYVKQGRRNAALMQYRELRDLLGRELGVEPDVETECLYAELLAGRPSRGAAEPESPVAASDTEAHPPQPASRSDDLPGIAVLPFDNLSPDPDQDYFAQGVVEDIIMELSRFRSLRVTARGASFAYRGGSVPLRRIGQELGVRYLLQGSLRRAGDTLRITVQLVEAESGLQLWADRYDVTVADVFDVQDRITRSVAGALAVRIDDALLAGARRKARENLQAYECWLRGQEHLHRGTLEDDDRARAFFQRALEIAPNYARAFGGIALSYFNEWSCNAWDRWDETSEKAFVNASRAVALDEADHISHCILGRILLYRRQFPRAEAHIGRALHLNPNDADALAIISLAQVYLGDPEQAVKLGEAALRLNPSPPVWYYGGLGLGHFFRGDLESAIPIGEQAPDAFTDVRAYLAAAYAHLDRPNEARAWAKAFLDLFAKRILKGRKPEAGEAVAWVLKVNPLKRSADQDYLVAGLRKAGI